MAKDEKELDVVDGDGKVVEKVTLVSNDQLRKMNMLVPEEEHRLRGKDGYNIPKIELRPEEEQRLLERDDTNWKGDIRKYKPGKPHVEFDDERKVRFVELLAQYGVKYKCAAAVGISTQCFNNHLRDDEEFAEAVEEAMKVFRDLIEETIVDRAVHGWKEPVFSQKLGTIIGWIHRFDNRLLELIAKRHIPAFREKQSVDVNVSGGVLVAPSTPANADEWKARHVAEPRELVEPDDVREVERS